MMLLPDWVRESRWVRIALQAAAALAVVALVVAGAWAWYRSQESRGIAALADATALVQRAQGPDATAQTRESAIKALEAVMADHPRLSAIPQVAYQLGNLKYGAGQYPAARGAYELALAKGASGSVRTLAGMGIGYTWEAEKNYANAAQGYDAVVTRCLFEVAGTHPREEELSEKVCSVVEGSLGYFQLKTSR